MQGFSQRSVVILSAGVFIAAAAVPAWALGHTGPSPHPSGAVDDQAKPTVQLSVRGGRGAQAGEDVRYRFSVRNTGRLAVTSVRVSTRLPRSLKHLRGGRFGTTKRVVAFSLGRIAPGRSRSRVLVARVAEEFHAGDRIELHAKVSARPVSDAD